MYDYRKMTARQREEAVARRSELGWPWHGPPHVFAGDDTFFLTAACYQHQWFMESPQRLTEISKAIVEGIVKEVGGHVHGWVVLSNHYHVLARVDVDAFGKWVWRLHNRKSTQWNREDARPGRKVWHRFTDRLIRSSAHFYASLNYLHGNPVKHGLVLRADHWPWSSLHRYLEQVGREQLADWWRRYPVKGFGKGWDD